MSKSEMIKWLQNLKEDIGQSQHQDLWHYAEMLDEVICTIEVSEDAISREQFREQMYHRCFEVDNDPDMQKWDSGNWLRWKLFEEELESAPSVIPQVPNEDVISREYMLRALNGYGRDWQEDCEIAETIKNAPSVIPTADKLSSVGNAPSVIPKSKEGEWIDDEYGIPHCSECNCINNTVYRNYCPNCGSKMKGEGNERI